MIKIRNLIIYIVVCIIVFTSFKLPEILLEMENDNIGIEIYSKNKKSTTIDVEAEKIYLIKAIHDIEEGKTVEISRPKEQYLLVEKTFDTTNIGLTKNIYEEMLKLEEYKIIKNSNLIENAECKLGLINKNYQNTENSYTINNIILTFDNNEYFLNIESKTGKILFFAFDKSNLYDENNKKEMLENYIKYLNLYIIDDWEYTTESNNIHIMKSDKANVRIMLTETSENYMFSFHIIDYFRVIDTN